MDLAKITTVEGLLEDIDNHRDGLGAVPELVEHIRQQLAPLNIRITVEPLKEAVDPRAIRILLSCSRDVKNFEHQLTRRANGLIIRVPLALPPRSELPVQLLPPPLSLPSPLPIPLPVGTKAKAASEAASSPASLTSLSTSGMPENSETAELEKKENEADLPGCSVLAQPPNNFTVHYGFAALDSLVKAGAYHQYTMLEGTTVTLYHYGDRWVIGSRRSYDAGDLVWRGYNFKLVLEHALQVACPSFSWSLLKPAHSYTIGYRHPAHHPFMQGAMWERKMFDSVKTAAQASKNWCIEVWFIRSSEPLPAEELAASIGIPLQREMANPLPLRLMCDNNKRALENYRSSASVSHGNGSGSGTGNRGVHMGYILRSADEDRTRGLSDVLLPSSLYNVIRDLIYESAFRRDTSFINYHRHLSFVLLTNYLDPHKKPLMQEFFPQFAVYYTLYATVFSKTVEYIALMARGTTLLEPGVDDPAPWYTAYLLATRLEPHVTSLYSPHQETRGGGAARVIHNLISDSRHSNTIYNVIHVEAPRQLNERITSAIAKHNKRRC